MKLNFDPMKTIENSFYDPVSIMDLLRCYIVVAAMATTFALGMVFITHTGVPLGSWFIKSTIILMGLAILSVLTTEDK